MSTKFDVTIKYFKEHRPDSRRPIHVRVTEQMTVPAPSVEKAQELVLDLVPEEAPSDRKEYQRHLTFGELRARGELRWEPDPQLPGWHLTDSRSDGWHWDVNLQYHQPETDDSRVREIEADILNNTRRNEQGQIVYAP